MKIYYFTRTHRSEEVAKTLADRHGVDANKIDDGKSWKGIFGFIRAGMYASRKKTLPVQYEAPAAGEPVIVVFPLWASSFPPGVRTFIEEVGRERITCVATSGGGQLAERDGFVRVVDLAGKAIQAPSDL